MFILEIIGLCVFENVGVKFEKRVKIIGINERFVYLDESLIWWGF